MIVLNLINLHLYTIDSRVCPTIDNDKYEDTYGAPFVTKCQCYVISNVRLKIWK